MKTQGPKVVDRSARRPLQVEARWGMAFEAVLTLFMLNDEAGIGRYERGDAINRSLKRGLAPSLSRTLNSLRTPRGDHWSALLGMIATDDPPYDVATVVRRLAKSSPIDLKMTMLGQNQRALDNSGRLGGTGFQRAAAGNKTAVSELLDVAKREGWDGEVAPLLRIPASELHAMVIAAIRDLPAELYTIGSDAGSLLERNANLSQTLVSETEDIQDAIRGLTDGLIYRPEPGIDALLLIPSLVHRPWTLVLNHQHTKVVCYPARLADELSAPAVGLIGLYRALGDATRLRILRRLAAGTATVGRMSEELGLAKSTIHEHLLSLRTAGLVRLPNNGGFELEPELPDLNWMLKEFLGLEMRSKCESCGKALEQDGEAYICSYECTYCRSCAEENNHVCSNCSGELVIRPRRTMTRPQRRRRAGHQAEAIRSIKH